MTPVSLPIDAPEALPSAVTKSAFAALIGVTPARVSHMISMGLPVRGVDGLIPAAEGKQWYADNIRPRSKSQAEALAERGQARADREHYEAELARIKVEERTGRLVDAAEVRAATFERARRERDMHVGFAARVASVIASETGADEARIFALLDREMREHLTRLADMALEEFPE